MSARSRVQRTPAFVLWIALALCTIDVALAGDRMFFDIPSGPAEKTLNEYQNSTKLQVLWPYDDVAGITTNAVHGEYDPVEALMEMTRGTPLQFEFGSEDSVTLTVKPPPGRRDLNGSYPVPVRDLLADRRSIAAPEAPETITVIGRSNRPTLLEFGSPTLAITRLDMDAFAYGTPQDLLRTLPQVHGGGPTEDTHRGFEAGSNAGIGAGVNLRGLGAGSTLTLVNGRRLAGSGTDGIFTDISNLPLSIVERIEILPDSSSTVYGADAVGGVVNFVLMDSFAGAQTDASFSAATRGQLDQHRVSQIIGLKSRLFDGLVAIDFLSRDRLPAADRAQAQSDLTPFGGSNFDAIQSNPATIIAGSRTWAVPSGQDGTQLTPSMFLPSQQNRTNRWEGVNLLPSQQRWSVYATGRKSVSRNVELFADALLNQRDVRNFNGGARTTIIVPPSNAFYVNPTGSPVPVPLQVAYDFSQDLGLLTIEPSIRTLHFVAGADARLDAWQVIATSDFTSEHLRSVTENTIDPLALNQALADSNRGTAFNPFGDGSHTNPATLDRIRGSALFRTNSHIWSGNLTASREIEGPAGRRAKLATGIDYRSQNFSSLARTAGGFQNIDHDMHRAVKAAFAALTLPVLGNSGGSLAPNRLELSLAGRYEDYSDFGSIATPRFGLSWAPVQGMVFRGTWSKSFRPPNLLDLDESDNLVTLLPVSDPGIPGGMQFVLVKSGKNAQLREERAKSWTLGFDLDIAAVPGLSTAATYFDTTFTNRMNVPRASTALLSDPALADLLTLNPTREQREAGCASAPFVGGPAADCMIVPVTAIADLRVRNSTLMRTSGIDLLGQYVRYMNGGTLTLRLDGTYVLSFSEAQTPNLPLLERVSTQNYPIDLRLRGSLDWQRGPIRANAFINYFDDYRDIASTPQRRVMSWTTLDLNFSYAAGRHGGGPLSGTTFSLSAENVFDRKPPFLNNAVGVGYDQENGELTGRLLSLSVRKSW